MVDLDGREAQTLDALALADGETGLTPAEQSEHAVLGVEHRFGDSGHLRIEAYDKDVTRLNRRFENILERVSLIPELLPDRFEIDASSAIVRGIALGDMSGSVLRRVLWKELWLGLTTGAVNGLVIAAIAFLWKGQLLLSLILAVALLFNMVIAAVVGTLIPIALKTSRVDPAIASSVIITTFTDVFGFFSFLGLATLLIRFLL